METTRAVFDVRRSSSIPNPVAKIQAEPKEPMNTKISLAEVILLYYSFGLVTVSAWASALNKSSQRINSKKYNVPDSVNNLVNGLMGSINSYLNTYSILGKNRPEELKKLFELKMINLMGYIEKLPLTFSKTVLRGDAEKLWDIMVAQADEIECLDNKNTNNNNISHLPYEQSLIVNEDNLQELLRTPPAFGVSLVKIEIYNIKNTNGWVSLKRPNKKATFVINSSDDPLQEQVDKVFRSAAKQLKGNIKAKTLCRRIASIKPNRKINSI